MPGRLIERIWKHDPAADAPAKYRRACKYHAFVPDKLAQMHLSLEATVAGLISEAEGAIRKLNETGGQSLSPLARLLLSTESIASSKIEGMQLGVRQLARAEATMEAGQDTSTTAREVLANIDAMTLAVEDAAIVR